MVTLAAFVTVAHGQKTEVTIGLSEQFFDTLLDAVFQNGGPPEFALSKNTTEPFGPAMDAALSSGFGQAVSDGPDEPCRETIKLQRESNGIRTAVRFRDGKIYAPLAFTGNYNPPLVGCVEFGGYAETNIALEFDQSGQRLLAKATVLNVSLNGSGGLGGSLVARMVQGSIDRKVNPIEVISLDKISFPVPMQKGPGLRMRAVGIREEIANGLLNIHIAYEFVKA
jgi:hypothetical protein